MMFPHDSTAPLSFVDVINIASTTSTIDHTRLELGVELIARQRRAVNDYLGRDDVPPVYGFNTLFGHLDGYTATVDHQRELLDGHLIGPCHDIDEFEFRVITATKLAQLTAGGAGMSAHTFNAIVASLGKKVGPQTGAWLSSYGSGDVVPASWWLQRVVGDKHRFESGDVMAGINGNFVSTAQVIMAIHEIRQPLLRLFDGYLSVADTTACGDHFEVERHAGLGAGDVQLPVSIRDPFPVVTLVDEAVEKMVVAVDSALNTPSGNPMFVFDDNGVIPTSQSSFLNYPLRASVDAMAQSVTALVVAGQRAVAHVCAVRSRELSPIQAFRFVQPPKVATSIVQQTNHLLFSNNIGHIVESNGIEDMADGALLAAHRLRRSAPLVTAMADILDSVLPPVE